MPDAEKRTIEIDGVQRTVRVIEKKNYDHVFFIAVLVFGIVNALVAYYIRSVVPLYPFIAAGVFVVLFVLVLTLRNRRTPETMACPECDEMMTHIPPRKRGETHRYYCERCELVIDTTVSQVR